jgi:hypothetical protein
MSRFPGRFLGYEYRREMRFATIPEYLAHEQATPTKSEFISGEILPMDGFTPRHNMIAGDMMFAFR